jgi:hypothetical protein
MKENTADIKKELQKTLRKIPNDFSLFDVKRYINLAISKIEEVEKRREKRELKKQERERDL